MRISDWSSDVCSSDLLPVEHLADLVLAGELDVGDGDAVAIANEGGDDLGIGEGGAVTVLHQGVFDFVHAAGDVFQQHQGDRKSVVSGKSVSVRLDLGGRRLIKKKKQKQTNKESNLT